MISEHDETSVLDQVLAKPEPKPAQPVATPLPPTLEVLMVRASEDMKPEDVGPRAVCIFDTASKTQILEICFTGDENASRLLATALAGLKQPRVRLMGGWNAD